MTRGPLEGPRGSATRHRLLFANLSSESPTESMPPCDLKVHRVSACSNRAVRTQAWCKNCELLGAVQNGSRCSTSLLNGAKKVQQVRIDLICVRGAEAVRGAGVINCRRPFNKLHRFLG